MSKVSVVCWENFHKQGKNIICVGNLIFNETPEFVQFGVEPLCGIVRFQTEYTTAVIKEDNTHCWNSSVTSLVDKRSFSRQIYWYPHLTAIG